MSQQVTKRAGAPSGTFTVQVADGSFTFDDTTNLTLTVSDSAANNLVQHPYLQLVGGSGTYVAPPAQQDVFTSNGVLSYGPRTAPTSFDVRGSSSYAAKEVAALQPFRKQLAKRATRGVNIGVLGDSTDEGQMTVVAGAADRMKSWPHLMGNLLRTRFPTVGETALGPCPNFCAAATDSTIPVYGWNSPTGWVKQVVWGPSATVLCATSGVSASPLVFTSPVGVDAMDLMFLNGADANYDFTVSVDGGAASASMGHTGGVTDGKTYSITVNPATTHTVTVTPLGIGVRIEGMLCYHGNKNSGIRVWNLGHSGSNSSQYMPTGAYNWVRAAPTTASGCQATSSFDLDLLIVAGAYNDRNGSGGVTLSSWISNLTTMVAGVRANVPSGRPLSAIYLNKWKPNGAYGYPNAADGTSWDTWTAAFKAMAVADPLGTFLTLDQVMPRIQDDTAFYSDTVHGNLFSYTATSDLVASYPTP